jgi:hypothetical protein
MSMLGGMGGESRSRSGREDAPKDAPKAKEEKKPNPVDMLKGLFGR